MPENKPSETQSSRQDGPSKYVSLWTADLPATGTCGSSLRRLFGLKEDTFLRICICRPFLDTDITLIIQPHRYLQHTSAADILCILQKAETIMLQRCAILEQFCTRLWQSRDKRKRRGGCCSFRKRAMQRRCRLGFQAVKRAREGARDRWDASADGQCDGR